MRNGKKFTVTSLFSGCGGMDLGFKGGFEYNVKKYQNLDYDIVFANDIDTYACQAYRQNLNENIFDTDINNLISSPLLPQRTDVLLGGFPCQDFSQSGKRKGFNSERGLLYKAMVKVAEAIKPKVFIAENVFGLLSIEGAIEQIKSEFNNIGFSKISIHPTQCADFEIPQNRKRVFIIGWQNEEDYFKFSFPKKINKVVTASSVIDDLQDKSWGEVDGHVWALAKRREGTQGNETTPANGLAYTVRAEHHMNIQFHPNLDRRISVREAARFQSFPDNFLFGKFSKNQSYKMIGNAVPPVMGWHIGREVLKALRHV